MYYPSRKTRFYIDGFNLYYGALKGTSYKWLNLGAFAQSLVPNEQIDEIEYFTAKVQDRSGQEGAAARQSAYLQALETSTVPMRTIFGLFKVRETRMWVADTQKCNKTKKMRETMDVCECCARNTIEVVKTEEKGSDVNLAVSLVKDAFLQRFELAVVISNDSDMQSAIDIAMKELELPVIVVNPSRAKPDSLRGTKQLRVKEFALRRNQFNNRLILPNGHVLTKPQDW